MNSQVRKTLQHLHHNYAIAEGSRRCLSSYTIAVNLATFEARELYAAEELKSVKL